MIGGKILSFSLEGYKITVFYGDKREEYLTRKLIDLEADILLVGFEESELTLNFKGVKYVDFTDDLSVAVEKSNVIILPVTGIDNQGKIKSSTKQNIYFSEEIARSIRKNTLVLVGTASDYLIDLREKYDFNLIETAKLNEFAILNSIPSAEGAIAKAMELTQITIHDSNSLVIGFGRVAVTLARMLKGLGANTFVAARNDDQLARAFEMNCHAFNLKNIDDILPKMDIIFNTVPAMVLSSDKLKLINKKCPIIDLASSPGGVDYQSALELGITAYLAPGLPGKVAPITAGNILGKVYSKIILDYISKVGEV